MPPVRPRTGPASLELGLGVGMLACALVAVPLGLDRVAAAPEVVAGLTLGRGGNGDLAWATTADAPPLVVLLVRLFACLPLGDLAARANLAAVACAVAAAVLLGRLAFRVLRSLDPVAAPLEVVEPEVFPEPSPGRGAGVEAADDSQPEQLPTIRPQLRVLPGVTTARPRGEPAAGRADPRATPSRGLVAAVVADLAAAPAPTRLMAAGSSRNSRGHALPLIAPRPMGPLAHEIFALAGGVACGLGSLGAFLALTSAPGAALTLVMVLAAWLQLLSFDRRPGTPRRGLVLLLLAGLALGAGPTAALFIWPAVGLTCVRLLRQGERWPLLAPGAFMAGAVVALPWLTVSGGGAGAGLAGIARAAWGAARALGAGATSRAGLSQLLGVGRDLVTQWGVVAGLAAAVGAVVLLVRRPRWFGFGVGTGVLALALVASEAGGGAARAVILGPGSGAWVVLSALIAIPMMLGVIRLAVTLGRARGAGALCLAVVAALWPLMDGGSARFRRAPGFPEALLQRAQERLEPGVVVDPGSPQMARLFRYGQALGLRPDLEIAPGAGASRSASPVAVHEGTAD